MLTKSRPYDYQATVGRAQKTERFRLAEIHDQEVGWERGGAYNISVIESWTAVLLAGGRKLNS
jgi:hypothetical protein